MAHQAPGSCSNGDEGERALRPLPVALGKVNSSPGLLEGQVQQDEIHFAPFSNPREGSDFPCKFPTTWFRSGANGSRPSTVSPLGPQFGMPSNWPKGLNHGTPEDKTAVPRC